MITSAAASRYARALADVIFESNSPVKPGEAVQQLRSLDQAIGDSAELKAALITPAIQSSRKKAALGKILEEVGVSPLLRNFIFVIVDHKRIPLLPQIREAFEQEVDMRSGYVRAQVTSAAPLDGNQTATLERELAQVTGKSVRVHYAVDESLIGGVMARIGSTVYDGSLRGQLGQMRRELMARASED